MTAPHPHPHTTALASRLHSLYYFSHHLTIIQYQICVFCFLELASLSLLQRILIANWVYILTPSVTQRCQGICIPLERALNSKLTYLELPMFQLPFLIPGQTCSVTYPRALQQIYYKAVFMGVWLFDLLQFHTLLCPVCLYWSLWESFPNKGLAS